MAFMDKNFLLRSEAARHLFFDYAQDAPIFDYHCHLDPKEVYENKNFDSITQAWLGGDHYKWKIMRSVGIEEKYITGDGDDLSKFKAYAKTLTYAMGNPLYHWSHLELQRFFDIDEPLTLENAEAIYHKANEMLGQADFRVRELIKKSNVSVLFTTDDPVSDLKYHALLKKEEDFSVRVLPAFRPDKALNILNEGFAAYIGELGQAAEVAINSMETLYRALAKRMDFFQAMGCRASDHGIKKLPYAAASKEEVDAVLAKALSGAVISGEEADKYMTALLLFLAGEYSKRDWAMELHMNVIRNNNPVMFEKLGPDTGYDSVADYPVAENLAALMGKMEGGNGLPKTVLFSGNENDNTVLCTLMGGFQAPVGGHVSKVQLGTSWWFNDHIDGMERQMRSLGNTGALGGFIGMLTDSRSFLSYPRHEYFRRILCNILGQWIEDGEYYAEEKNLERIVKGICYENALVYFNQK